MFIDARRVPKDKVIETDVCIVGAGAAGITLAREFIDQPFRVCLLESGGLEFDNETQLLAQGENVGHPYPDLHQTRLRYFGGTTEIWSGWCGPLEEIDFETREWIPHSGWPFPKSHLDPYYERAQSILQLGPYAYDLEAWETKGSPRLPFVGDRVVTKFFQFSPPTRFGRTYRHAIERAPNITTYLYANVVDIETTYTARTVTRVRAACLPGNKFRVSAKLFILATGGIENARLLLVSNKVQSAGLGNQNDLVGRFFMERPHVDSAVFLLSDSHLPLDLYKGRNVNGTAVRGVLRLSGETLRREKLLNFYDALYPPERDPRAVKSARSLLKAIRGKDVPGDFDLIKHLKNVISDIDDVAAVAFKKLFNRKKGPIEMIALETRAEQAPNPDSRVTLSAERDSLGVNRVRLDWRLSAVDKWSIRRAHEIVGQELGRAGIGRLKLNLDDDDSTWPSSMTLYHHHMGTTRMHIDPKKGVVNENCQVHRISNLFIASSSVFSTAGGANPTLTIVALAVRLADHVKRLMRL